MPSGATNIQSGLKQAFARLSISVRPLATRKGQLSMDALEMTLQIIQIATGIAVTVGVWFAVAQLVAQKQQQHREFENMYVQRYWAIMDQLSADYRLRLKRADLSDSDLLACDSYLQLCEDEADLYEAGRITVETWNIWKSGIDWMLEQDVFRHQLENSSQDRYPTLRRYINDGKLAPKYRGAKAALRGL